MNSNESKIIEIFQGNPGDAQMIKELLFDNGIESSLRNGLMGTIAPFQVAPGGFEPARLEVLDSDKDKALELVQAFFEASEELDDE